MNRTNEEKTFFSFINEMLTYITKPYDEYLKEKKDPHANQKMKFFIKWLYDTSLTVENTVPPSGIANFGVWLSMDNGEETKDFFDMYEKSIENRWQYTSPEHLLKLIINYIFEEKQMTYTQSFQVKHLDKHYD
jgi:hypothetical protein